MLNTLPREIWHRRDLMHVEWLRRSADFRGIAPGLTPGELDGSYKVSQLANYNCNHSQVAADSI